MKTHHYPSTALTARDLFASHAAARRSALPFVASCIAALALLTAFIAIVHAA